MTQGPVLFDLAEDAAPQVSVAEAPPVPDPDAAPPPQGAAMQAAARIAARPPSRLSRWFWALAGALAAALLSAAIWGLVARLMASVPLLGWGVAAIGAAFVLVCLVIGARELAALSRLGRIDGLRRAAGAARDLESARAVTDRLVAFYVGREETRWGRERLAERSDEVFDASALLELAEHELLTPLDAAAAREVEAAARQVATVTALVPLALADVATALAANLRMIRRVAEIYGGRAGTLGGWRLTRAVFAHLVATGAIAAGDDLLEPMLGGSVLSKLSRRFGEGVVNGALSARVGVAAMEVCRPLPFSDGLRPSVRGIVAGALKGLFLKDKG